MKIWLLTVGEPLPIDQSRLHRSGILSEYLQLYGHEVFWFSSTFDHFKKENRFEEDKEIQITDKLNLHLFNGGGYKRNISIDRLKDHSLIAKKFKNLAPNMPRPDLIISSYPTIELCREAVRYGIENDIPVVIDIRDLWPDIYIDALPKGFKWILRFILHLVYSKTVKNIFKNATSCIGISDDYLKWALEKGDRDNNTSDTIFYLGYEKPHYDSSQNHSSLGQLYPGILDKKLITFVGTFGRTYDLSVPIEAARHFQEKDDSLIFVFCGTGENEKKWKNKASGLKNVIFTGWLEKEDLNLLLLSSHIGLASYAKGAPQSIPNKIIEYMSYGLPIISSLEGESKEFLDSKNIGTNYQSQNLSSFIDSLNFINDSKTYLKMKRNSQNFYNENFKAKKVYSDYVEFVEKVFKDH